MSTDKNKKIRQFWEKYESKIVLFLGIFLVAGISFQFGVLQGRSWQQDPLIIEKVSGESALIGGCVLGESSSNDGAISSKKVEKTIKNGVDNECTFIGSKNSDKYHKLDCQWSKRIKEENKVCFKGEEDAKNKGYIPCSCVK